MRQAEVKEREKKISRLYIEKKNDLYSYIKKVGAFLNVQWFQYFSLERVRI